MLVILRFQTSHMLNRHQHCVFITYTTHDEQEVTISNSDLDFQGHPLRLSDCRGHVSNFGLFEITDLELVRIDTKIKSVSCIQPKITKVI